MAQPQIMTPLRKAQTRLNDLDTNTERLDTRTIQTRRNEMQILDGMWIFHKTAKFVYKLEAHETNPDALYIIHYRLVGDNVIPYDFENLVPLQGYAIGGTAWNEWFDNSANAENHIKNTLTYVGAHSNPPGLELTGLMEDMHVPDSQGKLLGTKFGKIVIDPAHLRAYHFDKTFTRKFTDVGWTNAKPKYKTSILQAESVVGVSNLPLGFGPDAFISYFESLGDDGLPRYQTEEVPLLYAYTLLTEGGEYFTWDSGSTPLTAATSEVVDRVTSVETNIAVIQGNGVYTLTPATRLNIGVGFGPDSSEALAVNMLDVELAILSQGSMRARLYNAAATTTTELDAGTIDANLMFSSYALGFSASSQLPGNGLATAYTGMTSEQATSYYLSEQGKLDYEDIYEGSVYYGFPVCQIGPEAFGWSKTRVTNLVEMRDQTAIRTPSGYLQTISQNVYRDGPDGPDNVFADNGPTTVGGIVAGTYDMWEWNSAGVDATLIETNGPEGSTIKNGATYPYHYPNGFHQATALTDLIFTRTKLAEFDDQQLEWIREACARTAVRFQGARDAKVSQTLKHIRDSTNGWSGITILDTPTDIRDAFILEAKSVLDNIDWTSNPEDGVKFNQMLANLLAYANPGPSVETIIADIQSTFSTTDALNDRVRAMGDITLLVGMNAWAFPELGSRTARDTVAGATAGVPDANGNTWTSEQITQAVNLSTYFGTVGPIMDMSAVAWDSTITWLAHPTGVGPWDSSYVTVGNSFFKFGTSTEFDAAWFGNEYQTNFKHLRQNAWAQPYVDAGALGGFRAPVFRGEKGRIDYSPLLSGVKALVMNFTVTDLNLYNTWRNDLPEEMSDNMFILVDTSFRREAKVVEGELFNTSGRVMVIEVASEIEGTTFFADHPPAGATVNVAYVVTGFGRDDSDTTTDPLTPSEQSTRILYKWMYDINEGVTVEAADELLVRYEQGVRDSSSPAVLFYFERDGTRIALYEVYENIADLDTHRMLIGALEGNTEPDPAMVALKAEYDATFAFDMTTPLNHRSFNSPPDHEFASYLIDLGSTLAGTDVPLNVLAMFTLYDVVAGAYSDVTIKMGSVHADDPGLNILFQPFVDHTGLTITQVQQTEGPRAVELADASADIIETLAGHVTGYTANLEPLDATALARIDRSTYLSTLSAYSSVHPYFVPVDNDTHALAYKPAIYSNATYAAAYLDATGNTWAEPTTWLEVLAHSSFLKDQGSGGLHIGFNAGNGDGAIFFLAIAANYAVNPKLMDGGVANINEAHFVQAATDIFNLYGTEAFSGSSWAASTANDDFFLWWIDKGQSFPGTSSAGWKFMPIPGVDIDGSINQTTYDTAGGWGFVVQTHDAQTMAQLDAAKKLQAYVGSPDGADHMSLYGQYFQRYRTTGVTAEQIKESQPNLDLTFLQSYLDTITQMDTISQSSQLAQPQDVNGFFYRAMPILEAALTGITQVGDIQTALDGVKTAWEEL